MSGEISYVGIDGMTHSCLDALRRLVQCSTSITLARLVSHGSRHGFLVQADDEWTVIRPGFTSGYPGTGPAGLAEALMLFGHFGVDVDEVDVDDKIMHRVTEARLSHRDLEVIRNTHPVRPPRLYDYIQSHKRPHERPGELYRNFPVVIPYAIIDERLLDLAIKFSRDPDNILLAAFRRLEDTVRVRSGVDEHGAKLFSRAFGGSNAPMKWNDVGHENEIAQRVNVFVGAYGAFRNPRAHSASSRDDEATTLLGQFLLVNLLFTLERDAIVNPTAGQTSVVESESGRERQSNPSLQIKKEMSPVP